MQYDIVTVCTSQYRDAYEFVISSWLRSVAARIHIFTDEQFADSTDRLLFYPILKSCDWFEGIGYKVGCCRRSLDLGVANLVFLDADCYLLGDIGMVFEDRFDVAVTRMRHRKLTVSTGVFFYRASGVVADFFKLWEKTQAQYKTRDVIKGKEFDRYGLKRVKVDGALYEQRAFSDLLRSPDCGLVVASLSEAIYNRKVNERKVAELMRDPKRGRIKVLHFYGNCYRLPSAQRILAKCCGRGNK